MSCLLSKETQGYANERSARVEGWPRLLRAARAEIAPVLPKKILAEVMSGLLPQQTFERTRTALLRAAGVRIGARSLVQGSIRITGHGDPCLWLCIGESTLISGNLHVDLGAPLDIGSHVRIGHNVSLLTISHAIGGAEMRSGISHAGPIRIGDGVWLASRVTVLANVSIGAGAVVAAGAVVTRDVAPNTLVAGVPARLVREFEPD